MGLNVGSGRVLVTGGAGFIGSSVVRTLLDRGADVRVLVAPGDAAPNLTGLPVERVVGDLLDPASVRRAVQGCDLVIHLAAIYAVWLPEPEKIYEVNVRGALNVVEACDAAGVRRLVHTSSIAAVGRRPDGSPADETVLYNTWEDADRYVRSKYISELEVLRRARELGLDVVVCNPGFPFGPRDVAPTPTGEIIVKLLAGLFPFWFAGGFNAVDVRDVAMGHVLAAERGRPFERYLLTGHNVEFRAFMGLVSSVAGVRSPMLRASRRLLLAGASGLEAIAGVTGRPPFVARGALAYMAERVTYFDAGKASEELGYTVRPLEESICDAVEWFRSGEFAATQGG